MSKLYIVPTPIGNLEDMTCRAIRILKEVDLILADDTRTRGKLLKHFEISTHMHSHHMHNEHKTVENVIARLQAGENIALISDAGTPAISDPGFLLVREALKESIEIHCLPGPTAWVPAWVVSGFSTARFLFEGFLPQKKGRQTRLKQLITTDCTSVMYESPYRIVKLLEELKVLGLEQRRISVSREISKFFEQTVRGTVEEVLQHFLKQAPKGEFVVCLEGANQD